MVAAVLILILPTSSLPCQCWTGTMKGNDEVKTTLYLCRQDNDGATGWLDWQGKKSGRNIRAVSGTWRGALIEIQDTKFLMNEPSPGWRFCVIDKYTLQVSKKTGAAGGEYISKTCRDEASIRFVAASLERCKQAEADVEKISRTRAHSL